MNSDNKKKVAKVVEFFDSHGLGTTYYCAVEILENGHVSPWCIGKIVYNRITNDGLEEIVKDAMDNGYDEVLIDDKVKKELGL